MSRWSRARAERWAELRNRLAEHGVTDSEVDALLRCQGALNRWACAECGDGSNWAIERDGDDGDGRPFRVWVGPDGHGMTRATRHPIRDLERGALRRAEKIAAAHGLTVYHQGDPRGCSLYLLRPGDVPEGQRPSGYYTRGIAVCVD